MSNGSKLQSHPTGGFDVAHYGLDSDLSFFHKEIDLRGGADGLRVARLDKHSSEAQIPHAQEIVPSGGAPVYSNFGGVYARGLPAGVR